MRGLARSSTCWAIEGDEGQIVIRYGRERSRKRTFWLGGGGTGDEKGRGVDGEREDGEEGESDFGEHDDRECREKEQITTAPGLRFGR